MHTGIVKRSPGIAGAVSAIALIIAACGSTQTSHPSTVTVTVTGAPPAATQTTVAPPPEPPPPVEMGTWAYDRSFRFQVTNAASGPYGESDSNVVFVVMDVANVGSIPQTYSADYQRLRDGEGRLFAPKASTSRDRRVDLNPGMSTRGEINFDVPEGTQISQYVLVVHSFPDSVGAAVRLHQGKA